MNADKKTVMQLPWVEHLENGPKHSHHLQLHTSLQQICVVLYKDLAWLPSYIAYIVCKIYFIFRMLSISL